MPFYRYECEECCRSFKLKRRVSQRDDPAECPDCGTRKTQRQISRVNAGGSSPESGG